MAPCRTQDIRNLPHHLDKFLSYSSSALAVVTCARVLLTCSTCLALLKPLNFLFSCILFLLRVHSNPVCGFCASFGLLELHNCLQQNWCAHARGELLALASFRRCHTLCKERTSGKPATICASTVVFSVPSAVSDPAFLNRLYRTLPSHSSFLPSHSECGVNEK
jgi:hypothetical protein